MSTSQNLFAPSGQSNCFDKLFEVFQKETNWGKNVLEKDMLDLNLMVSKDIHITIFERQLLAAVIQDLIAFMQDGGKPTYGRLSIIEKATASLRTNLVLVYNTLHTTF